jgi:hypothetical protein
MEAGDFDDDLWGFIRKIDLGISFYDLYYEYL